ncbi:MAG: hypothetical protein ACI9SB_002620 [Candidatus Azotimanducaceae bacterium]|jgi:hypothetical protein
MTYHYEVIAKMAAEISKQMLKLNNQLDKVIDKQNELTDPAAQKDQAIALIEALEWDEAAKLCTEQAKEVDKRGRLDEEEERLRTELEALREQLFGVANGDIQAPSVPATDED